MTHFIAYKISCVPTGRVYIGITRAPLERRWAQHKNDAARGKPWKLHKALRKWGFPAFVIEHVASATDAKNLSFLEQVLIAQEDSVRRGYNITLGGEGALGVKRSEATKLKLSAAHKGKKHSPEHIAKRAAALRGRKQSAEAIKNAAKTRVGRKHSVEWRQKQAEGIRKAYAEGRHPMGYTLDERRARGLVRD